MLATRVEHVSLLVFASRKSFNTAQLAFSTAMLNQQEGHCLMQNVQVQTRDTYDYVCLHLQDKEVSTVFL